MTAFMIETSGWTRWLHTIALNGGWRAYRYDENTRIPTDFCFWVRCVLIGTAKFLFFAAIVIGIWVSASMLVYGSPRMRNLLLTHNHWIVLLWSILFPPLVVIALVGAVVLAGAAVFGLIIAVYWTYVQVRDAGLALIGPVSVPGRVSRTTQLMEALKKRTCTRIDFVKVKRVKVKHG